jgi:predicted transposase/invertase (TIGR01784 family)
MLRYFLDISLLKKKLPIKQYVIYIGKEKLYMQDYINNTNIAYKYKIIDMRNIDCNYFLKKDNPDALILAILCDFKDKNPQEIIKFIIDKLIEYTKNDINSFRKYMLMLEELSTNRDLRDLIKEQEMLSAIRYEDLPSYDIGLEKGIEKGIEKRNLELIKKMKQEGFNTEMIAKLTDISTKIIQDL